VAAPAATVTGEEVVLEGTVGFVPDAPGADLLVAIGETADGTPVAAAIDADAEGVSVEALTRYDATRSMAHVSFSQARGRLLSVGPDVLADAWYLAQALIAAESLGAVQTCLEVSVAYAKERFTFGRAIGSYQALKHELTEVLRLQENSRGLEYYAGWARRSKPEEFPLAASAARSEAGHALDFAARSMINVHGGIGATWEHDAPLFFRRAQLSRRLLGGTKDATDRVAEQTLRGAAAA
jgi:alkylation response protein AidB-like acyl-CoA dehydrogenase